MAAPAIDTAPAQSGLRDAINKGTLNIGDDIKGTLGNIVELDKSLTKLSGTWASNISQTAKLGASIGALGSVAVNATFGIANISSAFNKLQGAKDIVDGAYQAVKSLTGVSKTLDFSEAILGTTELASNIKTLEETSDTAFNRISTASQIIFDNGAYQKWSIGAVAAYSKVESAAFRLATITTGTEESALSAVGARIQALRELQKETNFATNSTQTLNAQYDIASGGFNTKAARKEVGKASINLSEVGFGDLGATNQGIVKVISANKFLGDSYRDAGKRASELFATTKVGILTLDQLNSEAAELASTGAGAGIAFEEMAASLALVTTQGLNAGEGSTALKALISEIVNNSSKAQEALGTLRDEAGKPIQFGFGALKAEGLLNIVEKLGKATGGSRDALNRIFSSKEAATAANALLLSGSTARKEARATIDEAGTDKGQDKLKQSAKERGQTLEGAFRSSYNRSQAAVEDFGSGVGEDVKKNLQDTNTLLGILATRSSSSFGSFAGQLDGIANKFQAVSGFIGSVFSVVAPLAFFSFLFKNLGRLGQVIKQAFKLDDGDVKYETLAQKIEASIVKIAKIVVSKVKTIVQEVNEEISKVGQEIAIKTSQPKEEVQPVVTSEPTLLPKPIRPELPAKSPSKVNSFLTEKSQQTKEGFTDLAARARNFTNSAVTKTRNFASNTIQDSELVNLGKAGITKTKELGGKIGSSVNSAIPETLKQSTGAFLGDIGRNSEILRAGRAVGSGTVTAVKGTFDVFTGKNETLNRLGGSFEKLRNVAKPVTDVIGGAAKELVSFGLSTGLVGGGIALATTAIQGGITAFNAYSNAASIPEVKELAENLKELKGVAGLDDFVKSISDTRAEIQGMSSDAELLNTVISNLGQSFNILNGNAAKNDVFQQKSDRAIGILTSSINENDKLAEQGTFKAITDPEKTAKQKIQLGIVLNEEDVQSVKTAFQREKDELQGRAKAARDKAQKERDLGGIGSRERAEDFDDQADKYEDEAKAKEKILDTEQKRVVLSSQLKRLQSFNSAIPIAVSTSVAFNSSSKAQFAQLKETLDKIFTIDKIDLSKVDPQEFAKILPQLQGVLSNITVQADIDPSGAIEGLKRLTGNIRVMQAVASDPTAQKAFDEASKVVTDKIIAYNNSLSNSYTKLFSTISGAGAVGGTAIGESTKKNLQAIQSNIETLKGSLDKPNLSATEYADTLSKIADLSAEAFTVKNSGQITEELGKRKQLLTFNQGLLEVQKNIVSVFAQESKFGSFSVSLAQAKLAAAEKELSVKQESLAISAREEEVTKGNILQAAQAELGNRTQLLQKVLTSGNITSEDAKSKFGVDRKIDLASDASVKQVTDQSAKDVTLNTQQLNKSREYSDKGLVAIDDNQINTLIEEQRNKLRNSGRVTDTAKSDRIANEKVNKIVTSNKDGKFINLRELQNLGNGQGDEATKIAATLLDKTQNKESGLKSTIDNAKKSGENATGASKQLKERVANIDIESAKKVVQQAEQDLKFTVVANRLKQEIGALSETIARNEAAIDASFAPQQRLVDISKGVGDAFSSLGSTASSLFSASSLGAVFSNVGSKLSDRTSQVLLDANKEISKVTARLNTVQSVRDRVASANADAKANGVSNPDLQKQQADIDKQLKSAQSEYQRDLQYIKQKTVLEGVNASLERFGAIAKEGSDKLEKVANIANARLDLQGRKDQSTLQNNQATRGFTSSVLGLFGQNNPAAQALIGRNEILGSIDKTKADKNDAARSGEKELNTLEVQRQQLLTENLMLTNALTQTQLLGKLVEKIDPTSGIQVGDISSVNQVIGNIPKNIADAKAQTNKSLALNSDTQSFVRQETQSKIRNIDLSGQSQILDIAQKNPSAGLISQDLVLPALRKGIDLSRQQPIQQIADYKPFGDSFNQTQKQLQGIGGNTRDSIQSDAQKIQDQINKKTLKITNDFRDASPDKPQTAASVSGQQNLSVIVNNSISLDGVKTTFGGDSLNKVGAAVGKSGDVIQKSLNDFGKAFLDLSKTAFGV